MAVLQMPADCQPLTKGNTEGSALDSKVSDLTVAKTVVLPPPGVAPDWSEKTLVLLSVLTPLQRAFVEWYATGLSGAESYRRASGRSGSLGWNARNNACQISENPKVRAAIEAALKDRNFGARMDREWKLQVIKQQVEKARESDDHRLIATIPRFLRLAAELQGELPCQPPETGHAGADQRAAVRLQMERIVAEAKGFDGRGNYPRLTAAPTGAAHEGR